MIIRVTSGKGTGPTEVSAFDAALLDAGIGDYNLIALSSVIPVGSRVVVEKLKRNTEEIGWKLHLVYSKSSAHSSGKPAYTGLGWAVRKDGSGVFIEEDGTRDTYVDIECCIVGKQESFRVKHYSDEEEVRSRIMKGLEHMIRNRGERVSDFNINTLVEGIICEADPVCAIVAAFYESEGWKQTAENQ